MVLRVVLLLQVHGYDYKADIWSFGITGMRKHKGNRGVHVIFVGVSSKFIISAESSTIACAICIKVDCVLPNLFNCFMKCFELLD